MKIVGARKSPTMRFREAAGGERLIGHPPTTNKVAI